jgi:hypothetical protein
LASQEATLLVPLERSWNFLSGNSDRAILKKKKRTVQSGDAFDDTIFKQGFEVVKI